MSSRRSRLCQRSPRSSRRPWRTSRCRRRCWNIGSCLEAAAAVASSRRQQASQRGAEGAGPAAWRSSRSRSARSGRNGVLHDGRAGLLTPLCPWRRRAGGQHAQGLSVISLGHFACFFGPKNEIAPFLLKHTGGSACTEGASPACMEAHSRCHACCRWPASRTHEVLMNP